MQMSRTSPSTPLAGSCTAPPTIRSRSPPLIAPPPARDGRPLAAAAAKRLGRSPRMRQHRRERQRHLVHAIARARARGSRRRRYRSPPAPRRPRSPAARSPRRARCRARSSPSSGRRAGDQHRIRSTGAESIEPGARRSILRPPSRRLTRIGYPVCQVSAASAPERLPPARRPTSIARVGPLRSCASASRPSARRSSRGFRPGSAS